MFLLDFGTVLTEWYLFGFCFCFVLFWFVLFCFCFFSFFVFSFFFTFLLVLFLFLFLFFCFFVFFFLGGGGHFIILTYFYDSLTLGFPTSKMWFDYRSVWCFDNIFVILCANKMKNKQKIPHCRQSSNFLKKNRRRQNGYIPQTYKYMTAHFLGFRTALQ